MRAGEQMKMPCSKLLEDLSMDTDGSATCCTPEVRLNC